MNGAESRARDLEVDNAQLRAHLATFMNGSGGEETKAAVGMAMYDGLNAATVALAGPSGINEDAANADVGVIAADEGGGADDDQNITTEV